MSSQSFASVGANYFREDDRRLQFEENEIPSLLDYKIFFAHTHAHTRTHTHKASSVPIPHNGHAHARPKKMVEVVTASVK